MIPLPPTLGAGGITLWRLDRARHAVSWASGEGAYQVGGRWNPKGMRAVYAALDPATAILEVAVHKGFTALDTEPHVLTRARWADPLALKVVGAGDVPNANWLVPGVVSAGQQAFGAQVLREHGAMLVPSVVSRHSWNLVFLATAAGFEEMAQEAFALDPRLHPAG